MSNAFESIHFTHKANSGLSHNIWLEIGAPSVSSVCLFQSHPHIPHHTKYTFRILPEQQVDMRVRYHPATRAISYLSRSTNKLQPNPPAHNTNKPHPIYTTVMKKFGMYAMLCMRILVFNFKLGRKSPNARRTHNYSTRAAGVSGIDIVFCLL